MEHKKTYQCTLNLNKVFTTIVLLFPIFSRYSSPIPQVNLSEFVLFLFWIIALCKALKTRRRWVISTELLVLVCYIIFQILISLVRFKGAIVLDAVGSCGRLLIMYMSLMFLGKSYFHYEFGVQMLEKAAIVLTIYGLLQTLCSYAGVYLSTYIPLLPQIDSGAIDAQVLNQVSYGLIYRCRSLLREPAALSIYLALALAIELFYSNRKYRMQKAILFTTGCIISMSSVGMIASAFIWIVYWASTQKKSVKHWILNILIGFIGLLVVFVFIYRTGLWDLFIERTFARGGSASLLGIFDNSRFSSSSMLFDENRTITDVIFGSGLIDLDNYLSGFVRIIYCMGIMGLFCFFISFLQFYYNGDSVNKKILIIYLFLNIGTEILLGQFCLIYLPFIFSKPEINKKGYLEKRSGTKLK